MSDIGVLSQEYQNTAELFQAINQAVILFKKRFYRLTGAAQVTEAQLGEVRKSLAVIIHDLIGNLEATTAEAITEVRQEASASIPIFLVKRIEEKHQGDLPWYLQDLRALHQSLESGASLTEDQLGYLDELCEQFDAETSALHRKLWRK